MSAPVLRFEEATHTYYLDDVEIPGVTDIIQDALQTVQHGTDWHKERGSAAHACYAMLAEGVEFDYDPALEGYVTGWKALQRDFAPESVQVEAKVVSVRYRYAGTLDWLCRIDGKLTIIDYKQAASHPNCSLQLSAYALALKDSQGIKVDQGWTVEINGDGGYKIFDTMTATQMRRREAQFLACRTVYDLQRENRL